MNVVYFICQNLPFQKIDIILLFERIEIIMYRLNLMIRVLVFGIRVYLIVSIMNNSGLNAVPLGTQYSKI